MRLDQYLVFHKLVNTRNSAMKLIMNNSVLVDEKIVTKPGMQITTQKVKLMNQLKYVSRAGDKLLFALQYWKFNIQNSIVLDIGSSTGGFADVCLQSNVAKIYCVDVGIEQLHPKINSNVKVINLEKTNVKDLDTHKIPDVIDLVVCDLSFISSKYMFEMLRKIALKSGANVISLIKPQFELTKEILDLTKGKINKQKWHDKAIENVKLFANSANLKVMDIIESPIRGAKMQNKEFLIWCCYEQTK